MLTLTMAPMPVARNGIVKVGSCKAWAHHLRQIDFQFSCRRCQMNRRSECWRVHGLTSAIQCFISAVFHRQLFSRGSLVLSMGYISRWKGLSSNGDGLISSGAMSFPFVALELHGLTECSIMHDKYADRNTTLVWRAPGL